MNEMDFNKVVERIESKLDDIRDRVYSITLETRETMIKQVSYQKEVDELKKEVEELKTAYNKASGALKLLSLPGVIGFLYAVFEMFKK